MCLEVHNNTKKDLIAFFILLLTSILLRIWEIRSGLFGESTPELLDLRNYHTILNVMTVYFAVRILYGEHKGNSKKIKLQILAGVLIGISLIELPNLILGESWVRLLGVIIGGIITAFVVILASPKEDH